MPDLGHLRCGALGLAVLQGSREIDEDIERIKASEDPHEPFLAGWRQRCGKLSVGTRSIQGLAPPPRACCAAWHRPQAPGARGPSQIQQARYEQPPRKALRPSGDRGLQHRLHEKCLKDTRKNSTSGQRLPKFLKDLIDLMLDDDCDGT